MNHLKKENQVAVITALVEGNSIRSTERMTGVHRDTIVRLLQRTGAYCEWVMDIRMRVSRVQVDPSRRNLVLRGEETRAPYAGRKAIPTRLRRPVCICGT